VKGIDDILKIRKNQYNRIRKAQMVIAIIDATVTTDGRYLAQIEEKYENSDGSVATDFPNPQDLGENPNAIYN
jgi:hypothetical protein